MDHQCMMRNHTRHRGQDHRTMQCNLLAINPAALPYCTLPRRSLTCFSYHVFIPNQLAFQLIASLLRRSLEYIPSILLVAKQATSLVCRCYFQSSCSCVDITCFLFSHVLGRLCPYPSTSSPSITLLSRVRRKRRWQLPRIAFHSFVLRVICTIGSN